MMDITLKLSEDDIRLIGAALMELPFKVVAPVIERINAQIAEQQPKPETKPD